MSTINEFMTTHHKHCDELFIQAEAAVEKGNWDEAQEKWQLFKNELEKHFQREELILFPEFEHTTGMVAGPTQMMRMEHQQIRAIMMEMDNCGQTKDKSGYLGLSETLMVTIQQHNMKEEQILYPMTDNAIHNSDAIVVEMQNQNQ